MKKNVFFLVIVGLVMSCGNSKKVVEPTPQSRALDELVEQKKFKIESDWAYPLVTNSLNQIANSGLIAPGSTVGNISLVGTGNHFKFFGDSVDMDLPYYGERQLGSGGYNSTDIGIKFKGTPENLEIIKDEKKQLYRINFSIKNSQESCNVWVVLFPNWTSSINITSNVRTNISYKGTVSKLSQKDDKVITIQ